MAAQTGWSHWHLHPPGLSSITASHNIPSNLCNYPSAISPTWLRTLLSLMTDQCWPSQSAADKLPLIFMPSVFDMSRLSAGAGIIDSPHIKDRIRVCFSTLLFVSLLFLWGCIHLVPDKLHCFHSFLSLFPSLNSKCGSCFISDLSVRAGYQQSENTSDR